MQKPRWNVPYSMNASCSRGITVEHLAAGANLDPVHEGREIEAARHRATRRAIADVRAEVIFMALDRPEDIRKLRSGQFTGFLFKLFGHPRHVRQEQPIDVERLVAHVASQNVDDLGNFLP